MVKLYMAEMMVQTVSDVQPSIPAAFCSRGGQEIKQWGKQQPYQLLSRRA